MAIYIEDKVNSEDSSGTIEQKQMRAEPFNSFKNDIYNVGIDAGWTVSEFTNDDLHQFTKFIVNIASSCEYYNSTGTDAYILTQFNGNSNLIANKFTRPISVKFQIPNTNTSTAITLLINGSSLGTKNLKDSTGAVIGVNKLITGDIVEATYFPSPIDEWRLQSQFSSTVTQNNIQDKLFSVNSGRVDINGYADFLQRDSNTQITVLAGGGNPNLVSTYYNGTKNILQSNQVIAGITNQFNGLYKIIQEGSNAFNFFQVEGDFTGHNANNSPTLTNIVGLDWTKIAVGQPVSGLSIPAGATISSFVLNVSITLSANMSPAQSTGTARTVNFLNCKEGTAQPNTALINGMYYINTNPLQTYKRIGGEFVLTPFTQFGEFRIASGVIPATLTSYAYNGLYLLNNLSVTTNGTYSQSDNIGSFYKILTVQCKATVGDSQRIFVNPYTYFPGSGGVQTRGYLPVLSSKNITILYTGNTTISTSQNYATTPIGDVASGFYDISINRIY